MDTAAVEKKTALALDQVGRLIVALQRRGYTVIGPTVRDAAIVLDVIESVKDLPAGWTDEQAPGRYRLKQRNDGALFGYAVGPQSWKKYLHPAEVRLFEAAREDGTFRILNNTTAVSPCFGESGPGKRTFLGVRACELAAIAIQDKVLFSGHFQDPIYQYNRKDIFIVAVNCMQAASTCFCTSMQTGPRVRSGFDLALTELMEDGRHEFLVEVGSQAGAEIVEELDCAEASEELLVKAEAAVQNTAAQIKQRMETFGLRDLLYNNLEHPRWDDVARRCLSCANCTMVCPTCFCTTVEDVSDVTGDHAERWRKWDSCFSQSFSYIHGGNVRDSRKSRYRQWMTHKLASWIDQFGSSGCVGCGRCITWCPVGIDITEEVRAIRESPSPMTPVAGGEHAKS